MKHGKAFIDAVAIGMLVVMFWPQLVEKRLWLYAGHRAAREGARRCGQLAIALESAYHAEVAR